MPEWTSLIKSRIDQNDVDERNDLIMNWVLYWIWIPLWWRLHNETRSGTGNGTINRLKTYIYNNCQSLLTMLSSPVQVPLQGIWDSLTVTMDPEWCSRWNPRIVIEEYLLFLHHGIDPSPSNGGPERGRPGSYHVGWPGSPAADSPPSNIDATVAAWDRGMGACHLQLHNRRGWFFSFFILFFLSNKLTM